MKSSCPLDRYSLVNTRNSEAARAALGRVYSAPTLDFVGRERSLHAVVNYRELHCIRMSYGTFAANLHMKFPATSFTSVVFSIGGKSEVAPLGGQAVTVDRDSGAVLSPYEATYVTHNAEYERLLLSIDSRALASKLSAIIGSDVHERLKFSPYLNCARPSAAALRSHLLLLVEKLNEFDARIPDAVLAEFEQVLMVTLLLASQHNYSNSLHQSPPDLAPRQVRRAEEYIEANWRRAITLEDLAQVTGVSAFSLFRAFKKRRGYSPMQFLARVRSRRRGTRR